MKEFVKHQLQEAQNCLETFLNDETNIEKIAAAGQLMSQTILNGGKIISCGNGGSMSDAMHFAEELTGRYKESRKPIPAIAISDPGYLSCVANDFGYDFVFSRFVEGVGNSGDVLLAISTSGNSKNVIEAAKAAQEKNIKVVALTGKDGGSLAELADIEIRAPKSKYADRAQEIHIKVIHTLIGIIEQKTEHGK